LSAALGVSIGAWLTALVGLFVLAKWANVLNEYERGVVFRLGHLLPKARGPGFVLIYWPVEKMVRVSLRTVVLNIAPQDVITRDNVSLKVSAVVYFRVLDPNRAVVGVEEYRFAASQLSQTTLRAVLGQVELDELLSEREKINHRLQAIIDRQSEPWGVQVSLVEVKDVDLPHEMQRAIARQAEAEREKRAKIIHAEGEFAAAQRLADAAEVIAREPVTLQLRYLQTLTEIATEKNSTIVFPLPIDTLLPFLMQRGRHAVRTP
jgi:regulator of protease activity HflC (stomatin/prohibitin superfamily)